MGAADEIRTRIEGAWRAFRAAIDTVDLEAPTRAGWTAKEMLAHVAFWMETVPPYVTGAFRGDPSAFSITFPSGYVAGEGDWPHADVHNAREAAWARDRAAAEVMGRAERAHDELRAFLTTVTDDEVAANAAYFAEVADHLEEHRTIELST